VRCGVEIEGSFNSRTIVKVARTLTGSITRFLVSENCTGGRVRARSEVLPGHLTYEGFRGALPRIEEIFLLLSRIRIQLIIPNVCTGDYGTSSTNITFVASVEAGRGITDLAPVGGRSTIARHTGSVFCPMTTTLGNHASVMLLGTTTRISVLLI
jgi:hypothetical protein